MLRIEVSEESRKFRNNLQEWLRQNPPPSVSLHSKLERFITLSREWQRKLAEGKFIAVHWPQKYGGRGLSFVEEAIVQEELVRAGAPQLLGLFGLTMVGPVLIEHGTEKQREMFLSSIRDASQIWCQGFSEPGAGSDLAAIRTRAEKIDGGFLITGQKVWTSFAQIADWCFLLCRTSEEEKRHRGLTYLLMDMKSPGISISPLRQITGDEEFNEVFFEQVFVPEENVVGEIGAGWDIAISTLMYERVILTFARQLQSETCLRELLGRSSEMSPLQKDTFEWQIANMSALRALAYENLCRYAVGRSPGPEGSIDKLLWSESFQEVAKLAVEVSDAAAMFGESSDDEASDKFGREAIHRYLYSRGRTIAAGTSEIQRNIISDRILKLPRLRFAEGRSA